MDKATTVLYVMYGMPSCYSSGFTFAKKFIQDNFNVTVACDQDVSDLAQQAGVPFVHLSALSKQQTSEQFKTLINAQHSNRLVKLLGYPKQLWKRYRLRQHLLQEQEFTNLVKKINPNLLIVDVECHYAIIASHALKKPLVLCSRLFNHTREKGIPPLNSSSLPAQNWQGRVSIKLEWWRLRLASWQIASIQAMSFSRLSPIHYRSHTLVDVKAIAKHFNVNLSSIATTAQWFRPVAYTQVPIISLTLGALDFGTRNRSQFLHIGPMVAQNDYAFALDQRTVSEIDQFIKHAKSIEQKVIYCAMGTYAGREPKFVNLLRTLARLRTDLAFIIALGSRESVESYTEFSNNALLVSAAPQIDCLIKADATILHAGIASLQEALVHKVPTVCFSVGSNDQNGTLRRWVYHGLASEVSLSDVSSNELSELIDRLFSDEEMLERINYFSQLASNEIQSFSPQSLIQDFPS